VVSAYGFYRWLTIPPTQVENPVINGVHYVGASVSNLPRTEKLYHEALDLHYVKSDVISNNVAFNKLAKREGVVAQSSLMKSVNAQLRFMDFEQRSVAATQAPSVGPNGPGIAHVCFQVNQETHAYEHFLKGGATHVGAKEMVQVNPKNPVYYAYANDLDNLMVEIEHVDVAALNLPTPPKNNFRIRHVSLATNDMDRAVGFYSTLLETKNPRRAGHLIKLKGDKVDKISGFEGSQLEMAWFQVRNLELELIQYYNPAPVLTAEPRPIDALGYNMIVFDVVSLAAAKEKLLLAGGTIVSEPKTNADEQIIYARDLDGNLLGFQALAKQSVYSAKNFEDNGI
jgi:catechol 2,3-dioxygenase-like lactoylglutathione lyase family enzyme